MHIDCFIDCNTGLFSIGTSHSVNFVIYLKFCYMQFFGHFHTKIIKFLSESYCKNIIRIIKRLLIIIPNIPYVIKYDLHDILGVYILIWEQSGIQEFSCIDIYQKATVHRIW